jgi:CRP-like cAMP-binding protein
MVMTSTGDPQHATDCAEVLSGVDIFADFPREVLERLAGAAELRTYGAGETVVRQGDDAEEFFVVTRGRLEVVRNEAVGNIVAATLDAGQFFGEMALLQEGHRVASVRASDDAECLVLGKRQFEAEMRRDPNAGAVMATRLARRINALRAGGSRQA